MKKQFNRPIIGLLLAILCISSCKCDDYEKLLKDVPINPAFARNSPVTTDITLQLLEKPNQWGNFRMTADLKGQLSDLYLAYEVNNKKMVLRDDGDGADSVKGDGIFAAFVNIDTAEVKNMFNEQNASIARAAKSGLNLKDAREALNFLRFDANDSGRAQASHLLLLNDPNFDFENRHVVFNNRTPAIVDASAAFRAHLVVHLFPTFLCLPPPADFIPKSLMINNLSVVEDPSRTWNPVSHSGNKTGAWTFNNIINQMANKALTGVSATQFVLAWLQNWDNDISLNGDLAAKRTNIDLLLNNWKARSTAHGLPADTLDMAEAPFKLLAIVNRVDLRENAGYSSTNAGEGRFVFCVLNSNATVVGNSAISFTFIFEFGVNRAGCDVQNWGQQWAHLHTLLLGDPVYNTALQAITDQFVNANASPLKPNGSSLNQIRTDEIALASPWQLREFNIDAASHVPKLVTVKKTPRNNLNNSPLLANFINANCAAINANTYNIPDSFSLQPLLGVKSDNNDFVGDAWNAAITCATPATARQTISINTCNGCHGVETQHFPPSSANDFTHVRPAAFGSTASLSGFLAGETINDPISHTPETLADLDDRARKLQNLVCNPCRIFGPIIFRPRNMVH